MKINCVRCGREKTIVGFEQCQDCLELTFLEIPEELLIISECPEELLIISECLEEMS